MNPLTLHHTDHTSSDAQIAQLTEYLEQWENSTETEEIIKILFNIAELLEKETEAYLKMNPDPFDDRHPTRVKPSSTFGHLLKALFDHEDFIGKLLLDNLLNSYNQELNIAACRLILDVLPGLEASAIFEDVDGILTKVIEWAEKAEEPLQSYAIGLLAAAMNVEELEEDSKDENFRLFPLMLKKLKTLMEEKAKKSNDEFASEDEDLLRGPSVAKRRRISSPINECSNSSWVEMEPFMIGSNKIYPLTNEMSQRFIYQYLTTLGSHQELLAQVFEYNLVPMILDTIDLNKNSDVRLAFDALKYLASLLNHKKIALEFINIGGIQHLLKVHRRSVASNAVSYCLNCIAYHDEVIEKICCHPEIVPELVSYALWLIETSHDSSRTNTMIFFSLTFPYQIILHEFDRQDGLRKIVNEISMIDLFSDNPAQEEELFTKRQYAKHICIALKRYFEVQLIIKTQSLIRNGDYRDGYDAGILKRLSSRNLLPHKMINCDYDLFMEHVDAMLHILPRNFKCDAWSNLTKYGGAKLLIHFISKSCDWNFTGKADAVRSALDVIVVCSVEPSIQTFLCENLTIGENHSIVGMRVMLAAASGEIVNDADCQRSALRVIINCVCGPIVRSRKSVRGSNEETLSPRHKVWHCVRLNNGIMCLLNLLMSKTPITDADSIRALSCQALCGLAKLDMIQQMMSKFPLFTDGQIQALMKEPILQDKRSEHITFCKHCLVLIERVTGSPVASNLQSSVGNLNKAEVITQTKIMFNETELLQLIYKHLAEKGLNKTAQMLADEAQIDTSSVSSIRNNFKFPIPSAARQLANHSRQCATPTSVTVSPLPSSTTSNVNSVSNSLSQTIPSQAATPNSLHLPRKLQPLRSIKVKAGSGSLLNSPTLNSRRQSVTFNSPLAKRRTDFSTNSSSISLDSIVIEYLRKQHALCKNPVVTCPPFDLFRPHRCPESKRRQSAPLNITQRLQARQIFPPHGGMNGLKMHRRFYYSRFRPLRSLRLFDPTSYVCSAFSYVDNQLYVGADYGDLIIFNYITGDVDYSFTCLDNELSHVEPSWDNKRVITSSDLSQTCTILWKHSEDFEGHFEKIVEWSDGYAEFGKASQDKALGTLHYTANLYDLNTISLVRQFENKELSNNYENNIATFSPTDKLILNDGILWDVRKPTLVHKFDKFNTHTNGIFHPNGNEIISNSEIWDMRTYKLLKTVPALGESRIQFNQGGEVIYAIYHEDDDRTQFNSSFRTFDGQDYSSITTIDVKRGISSLSLEPTDKLLAIIENVATRDSNIYTQDKVIRLYEVGRSREDDDEDSDEDDDDEDNDDEEQDFDGQIISDSDMSPLSSASEYGLSDDDTEDDDLDEDDLDDEQSSDSDSDVFYQLNGSD